MEAHRRMRLALGSQDDVDTTAEAYQLGWKSDFSLSEFNYLFGTVRWQKDKFSGYDQVVTEARRLRAPAHQLSGSCPEC